MKIISGKYKGRVLEGFKLDGTRPTMDRVKESLFAMIQSKILGSIVLDLFAGSGNLAFEALSEGASFAYLVDHNKKAVQTIEKNMKTIGIQNTEVVLKDYKDALKNFKEQNIKFNLIFLDPPYETDAIKKSLELIEEYELLENNGWIVCESNQLEKIEYSSFYQNVKEKKYGDKYIVILEKL